MLSTYENPEYVGRALSDGAVGYLLKDATPEELGQAIDVAISGDGRVVSPNLIWTLFEDWMESGLVDHKLTRRERDILALLSEGRSNRSIAQHLYPSEKTVKAHLAAIFRKLGVTNRTEAAMMARQLGLGPVPGAVSLTDQQICGLPATRGLTVARSGASGVGSTYRCSTDTFPSTA